MAYTPNTWESGDVVTASKLNSLEQAVGELNMSYTPNNWTDGDVLSAAKMNALEQAVASGGGGGDFSTATLTTVNQDYELLIPTLIIDPSYELEGSYSATEGSSPHTVILYKGKAYLGLSDVLSTSGAISLDSATGLYVITGDCTVIFDNVIAT